MKRARLSILIPLLLILSAVTSSTLLFWQETRVASHNIQREGIDNLHAALTHLQNMLNTQLAADSLEDARLSLSVSALHPGIRTLLLTDENNSVMLANRYIWEGSRAATVSGYTDLIAQRVRQTLASSVSLNASLLHGYYPVTLKFVVGGQGVSRVGVLFVEYDLAPQFAQARHDAAVQASLVGALMIAVAMVVALLLHWLVSRRVKKLVEASQRFAAGDLETRVHLHGHDELAELGHAFDDMASQRKEAQEVLRENQHFLETLLEHIPNMLFVKDAKTLKFLRLNTAGEQLLGYSRDELMGKNDHDFFPKEQADFFTSKDREIIASGELWDVPEEPINTRYLGQRFLHTKKIPILANDGNPLYLLGISEDITERKLDEEALHRLNRELRAISNCNETLMRAEDEQVLLDDICRIICDDAGYRMAWVGFAENDEAKTIRPVAWAGVEDGYLAQAGICWANTERGCGPSGTAIRSGESSSIQDFSTDPNAIPWRDAALQRGYRSSIAMPLKDERTNTFGILTIYSAEPYAFTPEEIRLLEELAGDLAFGITVLRARTERKRAEESLRLLNERYTLATRAGRLGVWDWDLQKNELVWDDRMYELYGVKREDFAGAYEAWLQGVHPDDRAASDEVSKQAQRGEREYDTEFRVVWPDGSVHYLKAYGQFVRDAQGKPMRMTGVNFDITELKKAELSINELNRDLERRVGERTEQLKTANKELEAFAYSVSHDLRAPLRHIDGFLDLLRARTESTLDDKSLHYMDTISDAARRMGTLIEDLLGFSRMGRKEMATESVTLGDLLQEVIHEFDAETRGRNIDWRIGELPVVTGDRAMLHVVLVNLVSNALKFTQKREKAEVEVGTQPGAADEVVIFVRDNGAGFDMQYAGKLFGVFQRLHGADEFEGTGIGLANVRRIIGRHGGRTWAEGKVDKGATFYFSLPHLADKGAMHDKLNHF